MSLPELESSHKHRKICQSAGDFLLVHQKKSEWVNYIKLAELEQPCTRRFWEREKIGEHLSSCESVCDIRELRGLFNKSACRLFFSHVEEKIGSEISHLQSEGERKAIKEQRTQSCSLIYVCMKYEILPQRTWQSCKSFNIFQILCCRAGGLDL